MLIIRTVNHQVQKLNEIRKIPQKLIQSENEKLLSVGVQQRNNVMPKSFDDNSRIGFSQHPALDSSCQYNENHTLVRNDILGRTARIYVHDINHMHDTPELSEGYQWCMQFQRQAQYKTPNMGWVHNGDTFSKRNNYFRTLEDAIQYCKQMGYGYEVDYPKFRYHSKKSYADNMKWPGHDAEDPDQ
ncbi:hypothetical protein IMG5_002980 [Ichthyophthirius multifiliis]|uniref:NADH dehydrogenase [ubiquinone] iron-sulfur protein 4, mitochondrial n=1 Tax=Ichthyophthirius multifiliis TaxID=5932 RepID=G0QJ75_ICHMU|nr:hypothetical protein IMG5_002980 [Ichthyophthirius multifiliis]EGR34726.1 hypothetical protein IMG5_002980 [Ichthyophthirius multifiliis]|eukprot:XP_004040030.1 hypothetical protein IMG5_002980 [Ichthyophthirius multifiliis]